MASSFQIFKIVMGLIVAGFFLIFVLRFSGDYTRLQQQGGEVEELQNLKKTIESIYIYNTPLPFDISISPEHSTPSTISRLHTVKVDGDVPFFYIPGKKLYVYRSSLDLGFFGIDWVGVLPELTVSYNPLIYTNDAYSTILSLTEQFPESNNPLIKFGFCGGLDEFVSDTKNTFLQPIKLIVKNKQPYVFNFTKCDVKFPKSYIKIIISDAPFYPEDGFLLLPESATSGKVLYKGKDKIGVLKDFDLVYKDALDIFSVIIGGEELYNYKNKFIFEKIVIYTGLESKRANNMRQVFVNPQYKKTSCVPLYGDYMASLNLLNQFARETDTQLEWNDKNNMDLFAGLLADVNKAYTNLVNGGCE